MANKPTPLLRIVHKKRYNEQHFFLPVNTPSSPTSATATLPPSTVVIQTATLGISSNNLSYCALGDFAHWYSCFALPSYLQEPYDDATTYAVSPGWGYARITHSSIPELRVGRLLYGFVPTCDAPFRLQLTADGARNAWNETSEARAKVMSIYNRYWAVDEGIDAIDGGAMDVADARRWRASLHPLWGAAYVLNRFVFGAYEGEPVIEPFPGVTIGWDAQKAELSKAVVVCIGAGTRTSKAFVWLLENRRGLGRGPLGVLEVTSAGKAEANSEENGVGGCQRRVVSYAEALASTTLDWILRLGSERIVVIGFGGRGTTYEELTLKLRERAPKIDVMALDVGGPPAVVTAEEQARRAARTQLLGAFQMNTSPVYGVAASHVGEQKFHDDLLAEWRTFLASQAKRDARASSSTVLGLNLDIREGVRGGVEDAWSELIKGEAPADAACVVEF
jgi:hypothetical protein